MRWGGYGTDERQERCVQGLGGWRDLRERDHLEELGVDGNKILKLILKKWGG